MQAGPQAALRFGWRQACDWPGRDPGVHTQGVSVGSTSLQQDYPQILWEPPARTEWNPRWEADSEQTCPGSCRPGRRCPAPDAHGSCDPGMPRLWGGLETPSQWAPPGSYNARCHFEKQAGGQRRARLPLRAHFLGSPFPPGLLRNQASRWLTGTLQ